MRHFFAVFLAESRLQRVTPRVELPSWVRSQGHFNVEAHFLVFKHLTGVCGETHFDAHFPSDHCPIRLHMDRVEAPMPVSILGQLSPLSFAPSYPSVSH